MHAGMYSAADARRGLLLISMTALLWGTVGVASRAIYTIAETNALSIGFFRLAFAIPVLLLACWRIVGPRIAPISRHDMGLMVAMGAATALYQVCFFAAVARIGVTMTVLIALCTAPVIVALLSIPLLGEGVSLRVVLALGGALGGTVLLMGPSETATVQPVTGIGLLLALGAASSYAVTALCSRALAGRYHPLQPLPIVFSIGALLLLPCAILADGGLVRSYPPQGWLLLLHLGLLPTALGYILFVWGLRTTTATIASIATLLEPLTAALLAWLIFQEHIGPQGLQGAALLLAAMILLLWKPPQR